MIMRHLHETRRSAGVVPLALLAAALLLAGCDQAKDDCVDCPDCGAAGQPADVRPADAASDDSTGGPGPGGDASDDAGAPSVCLKADGSPCDDDRLCTRDYCDDAGECQHEEFPTLSAIREVPAPAFALNDANPHSATNGQVLGGDVLADTVVVLVFHSASCDDCVTQSVAAREVYELFRYFPDIVFATVNGSGEEAAVDGYVNGTTAGGLPAPSAWPVLQDTTDANVWTRFCAATHQVFVIGRDGRVKYAAPGDFEEPIFRAELADVVFAARIPL